MKNTYRNLTKDNIELIDKLFDFATPDELRDDLIEIYHSYIISENEAFPVNFDRISANMYHIIQVLNELRKESADSTKHNLSNRKTTGYQN
jgi:hypothetical protein